MHIPGSSWTHCITLAEHFLAVGQRNILLGGTDSLPWHLVPNLYPAGSRRLGMDTNVEFEAIHPCGLRFQWFFDLETRDADGKDHYSLDIAAIQRVTYLLPPQARHMFVALLTACADAIRRRGEDYAALAAHQAATAQALLALAGDQETTPC